MVLEHCMDLQDDTGQIDMTAFRCASCGEVIGPNRRAQSKWTATVVKQDMATDQAPVSRHGSVRR